MTIGFTKKLLVVAASATVLALGGAPAGFAGEDDGPTANGEQIGAVQRTLSSSGSKSSSSKSTTKKATRTLAASHDTKTAKGAAQTGFGGMADTPGQSLLFALLLGFGGVALLGTAGVARRSER